MDSSKHIWGWFQAITFVSCLVIIIGSAANDFGWKFTVATKPTSSCSLEVFVRNVKNSQLCCSDEYHKNDWVCIAVTDSFTSILSSSMAFVIPLLPWLFNTLVEYYGRVCLNWSHFNLTNAFKRFAMYSALILVRTVSLFDNACLFN